MKLSRRAMLAGVGSVGVTSCASSPLPALPQSPALAAQALKSDWDNSELTRNEKFWSGVRRDFDVSERFINLENGYWGLMARPVFDAYARYIRMVNKNGSHFVRREYNTLFDTAVARTTEAVGAKPGELVLTRGATEALKSLIGGYRGLNPGDVLMYADLDYYSMQDAIDRVAKRDRCAVVRINIPEPVTYDGIIQFYSDALKQNPRTKLLLLTHVNHKTGLIVPVREITAIAREHGVDVIVDAAHSIGQIDYSIDDLGADFIGFNLHKWIGAPVGVGAMYVKASRLNDITPDIASSKSEQDNLEGRVHTGTANFAAMLTVPAAFDYHEKIGRGAKEARLRYLRNVWVDAANDIDNLQILAPDDKRLHAAITSFRIKGITSVDANKAIVERLLKEHGVFTVHRTGITKGACVRVTPSIFNSVEECLVLERALRLIAKRFV